MEIKTAAAQASLAHPPGLKDVRHTAGAGAVGGHLPQGGSVHDKLPSSSHAIRPTAKDSMLSKLASTDGVVTVSAYMLTPDSDDDSGDSDAWDAASRPAPVKEGVALPCSTGSDLPLTTRASHVLASSEVSPSQRKRARSDGMRADAGIIQSDASEDDTDDWQSVDGARSA
ncbi:hypothetical protein EON66_02250 [archaeon]|nr:MAG: hypothetical protein EON66_02250 [archaeon]